MRKKALKRKGPCQVFWGSHGCAKQRGHIGQHVCSTGCIPCPETGAFGDDWDEAAYAIQLREWREHRAALKARQAA
jgi:hypothetical protein